MGHELDSLFGDVRSLMNQDVLIRSMREALSAWIEQTALSFPDIYHAQWLPYLASYEHHWREPLTTVSSVERLELMSALAPFAVFDLTLDRGPRGAALYALLRSPAASAVRLLIFRSTWMTPSLIKKLASTQMLTSLKGLALDHMKVSVQGVEMLMQAPFVSSLETLSLKGNRLGIDGARALASASHMTGLRTLDFSKNYIDQAGLEALLSAPHFASLVSLTLCDNCFDHAGGVALANATHLTSLESLDLDGNTIGVVGARALANSPHFASLRVLSTRRNIIQDEGYEAIIQSPYLHDDVRAAYRKRFDSSSGV